MVDSDSPLPLGLRAESTTTACQNAATAWEALAEKTKDCKAGILAYNGEEAVKVGERLFAIPLGTLLS